MHQCSTIVTVKYHVTSLTGRHKYRNVKKITELAATGQTS